jgi:hypothetical protein
MKEELREIAECGVRSAECGMRSGGRKLRRKKRGEYQKFSYVRSGKRRGAGSVTGER